MAGEDEGPSLEALQEKVSGLVALLSGPCPGRRSARSPRSPRSRSRERRERDRGRHRREGRERERGRTGEEAPRRPREGRAEERPRERQAGGSATDVEPPRVQVEGPDAQNRHRASHQRVTSASADGHTSVVHAVLVLGPWRAERSCAARDAKDLGSAFERRGAEGLAAAQLAAEAAAANEAPAAPAPRAPPLPRGARGWELELARDGLCRALCRFDDGQPRALRGRWRPSRGRAEEDAAQLAAAFREGGFRAAQLAAEGRGGMPGAGGAGGAVGRVAPRPSTAPPPPPPPGLEPPPGDLGPRWEDDGPPGDFNLGACAGPARGAEGAGGGEAEEVPGAAEEEAEAEGLEDAEAEGPEEEEAVEGAAEEEAGEWPEEGGLQAPEGRAPQPGREAAAPAPGGGGAASAAPGRPGRAAPPVAAGAQAKLGKRATPSSSQGAAPRKVGGAAPPSRPTTARRSAQSPPAAPSFSFEGLGEVWKLL